MRLRRRSEPAEGGGRALYLALEMTAAEEHRGVPPEGAAPALERLVVPGAVPIERSLQQPLRAHWMRRAEIHTQDSYAGVSLSKFPEDLRTYEHILWAQRPNVVIELGVWFGASALWFRDRLRTLSEYGRIDEFLVIGIDVELTKAEAALDGADPSWKQHIRLLAADVCDPELPDRVAAMLPPAARCFVIEDSAHTYETTAAALAGFARFVPAGGFMMVEDGAVDIEEMRLHDHWPDGVLPALTDWLATPAGADFRVRRDLEVYGVTGHPGGLIQRAA